jgi:predicted O-methyltransferase YrrM
MPLTTPPDSIADIYAHFPTARTTSGIPFINIADEYVDWLTFINPGMLAKGNLLSFDYALSHLPSHNPMLEIGVFAGLSTNLLTYYRARHNVTNTFINCDRWQFEGAQGNVGDSTLSHADYRTFVRDSYLRNVNMFSANDLPHTIERSSDELFAHWNQRTTLKDLFGRPTQLGGPISFCYIDGDHSYEPARRDFKSTDRHLEPGGFILFDDSADGTKFEVGRVVEEVKRLPNYRVVIKNPNYLVQKLP